MSRIRFIYPFSDAYTVNWATPPLWSKVDDANPNDSEKPLGSNDNALHGDKNVVATFTVNTGATISPGGSRLSDFPKSCGFQLATMWHKSLKPQANDDTSARAAYFYDGAWRMDTDFNNEILTTSSIWYAASLPVTHRLGMLAGLENGKLKYQKGTGKGFNHDRCRNHAINLGIDICFDTAPPSMPTRIEVNGKLLNFSGPNTMQLTSFPTFAVRYVDNTNATGMELINYDESKYVHWIIGTQVTGGTVEGTIWNSGTLPAVVSIEANVSIAYSAATLLELNTTYYLKCRIYDANENISPFSSVASFSFIEPNPPDATWWDNNWTRRTRIHLGNDHGILCKGYTVSVPFETSVFKTVATGDEVEINESVVHPAEDSLVRIGNKTFMCWRSHGEAHVSCKHYNHTTGTFGALVTLGGPYTSNTDIHFYPVMGKDSSSFIYILIGQHSGSPQPLFRSTSPAVLDFPSSPATFFGNGTYPRLRNRANGSLVLFSRAGNVRHWYFYRQIDGTRWQGPNYFINYDDAVVGAPVIYCGGVQIDQNDGFHFIITYRDGYNAQNYTRGVGYIRSVDGTTWTTIKGTIVGTTTSTSGHASNINWASGSNSVVFQPVAFPAGPFFQTNGIGFRRFPSGTLLFTCAKQPATIPWQWFEHHPADIMVAVSNTSSGWGTTNLSNVVNKKIWTHRQGMAIEYVDDPDQENLTTHMLCYVAPTVDEQFSCEVGWFYSFDYGNIWHYKELSRTSAHGQGMICALGSTYDKPEFLLGRLKTVLYWDNATPTTSFIQTGDDLRIVWGTRQLDRSPEDHINYDNTKLNYSLQGTIPKNFGYDKNRHYYIYYGNYFALNTPPRDPNKIFRFYEGWELYDNYRVNPTGDGWEHHLDSEVTYLFGTLFGDQGPNKIYGGRAALRMRSTTTLARSMPTYCNYFEMDVAHWDETGSYSQGESFQAHIFEEDIAPATFPNFGIEEGVLNSIPASWTEVSGTISKSDDYAIEETHSLKLLSHSNEAVAKSTLIILSNTYGFDFNWSVRSELRAGPLIAGTFPKVVLTDANGATLGSLNYNSAQGVWINQSISISTVGTTELYIKCLLPRILSGAPGTVYFDNFHFIIKGLYHTIGFYGNSYLEEYSHNKHYGIPSAYDTDVTFSFKQYHLLNVIYGTQVKSYLDGKQVGFIPNWNPDGKTVDRFFYSNKSIMYVDYIRFKDWVPNAPEAVTTLASIKDLVGFQRISNTLDLAYIRAQRFSNIFETDKEVIERIANYTTLEFVAVQRIANIMLGSKTDIKYIANMMVGDRVLTERIANIIQTDKDLSQRVSNITTLEKKITLKIANMVVYDKEIHHRMANVLQLDKDTVVRFSNLMQGDKVLRERISNTLLGNKELINRISSALTLDEEVGSEISNLIQGDKVLRERIANIFSGNKELVSKISNILQGDKELRDRIANVLQGDKVQIQRIANIIEELEVTSFKKIAGILQGDKELIDRISNILQTDKKTAVRIVSTIEDFQKSDLVKISNIFNVDKEIITNISNMIQGDKDLFDRISSILQGNKELISRIASVIETFDKTFIEKISNIVQGDKEVLTEVSNILQLDSSDTLKIANVIDKLEVTSFKRIANILQGNKELIERISNILQSDKQFATRIANTIEDFQKSDKQRISNIFNVDKESITRVANVLQGNKQLTERISSILQGNKELISRVANTIETFDKTDVKRIANILQGDKESLTEIASILQLEDSEVFRIANTIEDFQKSDFERFSNIFQGNKELVYEISNILQGDKELTYRITGILQGDKEVIQRVANILSTFDKETTKKIASIILFDKEVLQKISNLTTLEFSDTQQIANIIEQFDKTDTKKIANILQGNKEAIYEISNILQGNKELVYRLSNIVGELEQSDLNRISSILQTDKETIERISSIIQGDKTLISRIANTIEDFQKSDKQRISNIFNADKKTLERITSILQGNKELSQRVNNILQGNKELTDRIVNTIESFDSTDILRISNLMQGDKEALIEMANILQLDTTETFRIANTIEDFQKSDFERIASDIQFDKTTTEKISNLILWDNVFRYRLANMIEGFDKEEAQRISNLIQTEKELSYRVANILQGNKNLTQRFANIIQGEEELSTRVSNTIEDLELSDLVRISNIFETDKEVNYRIANSLLGNKEAFIEIANTIILDIGLESKISNILSTDKEVGYRVSNLLEFSGENTLTNRYANIMQLDIELSERISSILTLDKILTEEIANDISFDKEVAERLANTLVIDKIATQRISDILVGDQTDIYKLASQITSDKEIIYEIASGITLEMKLDQKVANLLIGQHVFTQRFSNFMKHDKDFYSSLANMVSFLSGPDLIFAINIEIV